MGSAFDRPAPSQETLKFGVGHVVLTYHYRDTGEVDGYASLLDEGVELRQPGAADIHGRAEAVQAQAAQDGLSVRHELLKVIAEGDAVVVTGRIVSASGTESEQQGTEVDFVDVFTLSDDALIMGCRRYYFLAPHWLLQQSARRD